MALWLEAAAEEMLKAAAGRIACSGVCNARSGALVRRGRALTGVFGGVAGLVMRLLGSGRRLAGLVGMTAVAQWMAVTPVGEVQEVMDY